MVLKGYGNENSLTTVPEAKKTPQQNRFINMQTSLKHCILMQFTLYTEKLFKLLLTAEHILVQLYMTLPYQEMHN